MAAPQNASLAPFFSMSDGMQIVITAVDATTGATVTGVVVSNVSLSVDPDTPSEPIPATNPTGAFLPA